MQFKTDTGRAFAAFCNRVYKFLLLHVQKNNLQQFGEILKAAQSY